MDRKAAGVTDIVANLATEDAELRNAAFKLKEKREREEKKTSPKAIPMNIPAKNGKGPKLVSTQPGESQDKKEKSPKSEKRSKSSSQETWSNPTAALNTRIPPEMDQLLDDHLANQKKQWKVAGQKGQKPTKQKIVQTALAGYFKSQKSTAQ